MRGIRTPSYPALPECSAIKTSMVAPKFNACREAGVETLPVALHRFPWSLGRSTPIHHATPFFGFFERLGRVQFVRRAGWNRTNVLLYPKQADYHFPTARGTIFI